MRQRLHAGKPAEITFTYDFHELVAGDPRPGGPLLLRYDPNRIVPAEESYRFGDPERPVMAHVRFREGEAPIDVPLRSPGGIVPCPDVDLTGQGSMLSAQVMLPEDAERLTVWFSYTAASGAIRYDSDYGANYPFGFPCREIDVVRATVTRQPDQPGDRFDLTVSTTQAVEDARIQFFLVGDATCAKQEVRLQRVGEVAPQERTLWAAAIDLPHGATARFKVCYWIGGQRLVDDNTGAFYLAPEPEPDSIPPPPPALLEAAAAWG